ncbi:solute carrier family 46 member 3-like [Plakobranchus ocellatus]|uniref:Solute carrier family 46 member 3-like n=1 Tax=Plakobranchus ocellatus TaxID=259542 RepID=A0AAV4ATZ0_9GAST|nr:solute carrier family 46 member 3-like [Plakobranchus ocellatus]
MFGRASWCESLGPVNPLPSVEKTVNSAGRARSYSSIASSGSLYTSSTSRDSGLVADFLYDEEETLYVQSVIRSMSSESSNEIPPAATGASRKDSELSGIETAPPTVKSRLLHPHRPTAPVPWVVSDSQDEHHSAHQYYGSMGDSPSNDYSSSEYTVNTVPSGGTNGQDDGSIQKLPFMLISLIVMCVGISSKFHSTLVDQYVYQQYADMIIGSKTHTASNPCFHGPAINSSHTQLVRHVQEMTSEQLLRLDLTLYGLGIPACIILGILSRYIGRKLQLFIPLLGYTLKNAGLVVLVYFKLNLDWLYLPYTVEGICGNYVGILLGVFLYASDISGRNRSRTVAMVIMEGVKGGVTAALNVVVGELIENTGFKLPAWLSLAGSVAALLLIFTLPNRKPQMAPLSARRASVRNVNIQGDDTRGTKSSCFSIFLFPDGTFHNSRVKKMLKAAFIAAFFLMTAALGLTKIKSLYLMDEPICWSSSTIGWFSFGGDLSSNSFTVFIGPLLLRCLPGMTLGVLGMLSSTGGALFLATATKGFQLIFQPAVDVGRQVPMGIIRGELSRLIGPQGQGTLFACIAVMESFCFALGATFLYVYNATLGFYKGTVAILAALFYFTGACSLIYFQRVWRQYYEDSTNMTITEDADGDR